MDKTEFDTGAVRSTDANHAMYHLISPVGMRRLGETMKEGFDKYGAFNYEKGMPIGDTLNHALQHIFNYLDGDRSEDHLAHGAFNLFAAMHMEERHLHNTNLDHQLRDTHSYGGRYEQEEEKSKKIVQDRIWKED